MPNINRQYCQCLGINGQYTGNVVKIKYFVSTFTIICL